ncbi:2199_t:CDS:10, partial [Paraglomus occultum]
MSKVRPFKQRDFTGWQESLDPEELTLLSLLSFRRKKWDFSFSPCEEHFAITKFLESIPEIVTDKRWILAAERIKYEAQTEELKAFWIQVNIEKIETEKKLKEYEIELRKAEFAASFFKMGNEAHKIQDKVRIDYVLNSHANTSQGKDHESDKVSGKKRFASFDDNPFVTPTPKYVYSTKRKREEALNTGTQEGSDNEIIASDSVFDDSFSLKDSEWKLKNGELVTAVLARLGLSSIVDLTSEFTNGMWTFFGEDWDILKAKVYNQLNITPLKFEGIIHKSVKTIEEMCNSCKYWEAREFILDEMKNQESGTKYQQILKIYFIILDMFLKNPHVFICENGQMEKLTEMEYVLRMIAPILDIVFSDVTHIVCLRWGETMFKTASARRIIDLRVVCHGQNLELSHSECARATTPSKAVRDRSKCLRTNQCILNEFLRQDISEDDAENSVVFGLQFAALCGQLIGVELVDDGLYFGIEGDSFLFPSQLTQMKLLRHALEVIYFFKDNILHKAEALAKDNHPYKKIFNSRKPKPKHQKLTFIRSPDFTPRQNK